MKSSSSTAALIMSALAGVALATTLATTAHAQTYPSQQVRMVVVFPAGGVADIVARLIADKMSDGLGQRIVVENVPGAGGNVGSAQVARAAPDGHTILNGQNNVFTMNPHLYQPMPFDPLTTLVPVSLTVTGASALVVNPGFPAKSLADFLSFAKANPGKINYASFGNGSVAHINGEMLKRTAGIDMVHVPYRGAAPALNDVLAGHVNAMFDVIATVLPHVQAGKLNALAVVSPKRSAALPDVPALAEMFPGFDGRGWQGLFVPAGTPRAIVDRLNAETSKALVDPGVRKRLGELQLEPEASSPEALAARIKADHERWGKLIRESGIRL